MIKNSLSKAPTEKYIQKLSKEENCDNEVDERVSQVFYSGSGKL